MFINWLIGRISKNKPSDSSKVYPMVLSIHEEEVDQLLDWMRNHQCKYINESKTKLILKSYSNKEIIENGLLSMALEQYSNDSSTNEPGISIVLTPSISGTKYKMVCMCGEEYKPHLEEMSKRSA